MTSSSLQAAIVAAAAGATLLAGAPALAASRPGFARALDQGLQCVPYARRLSGIQLFGDARTWWRQASGRYARGERPAPGAVMAFKPHGRMQLGHVATVSKLVDTRTVLLRHANWSPIGGRRGQVEQDVPAIDVSPNNDWSSVRVWYHPARGLGTTRWPVQGFIYNRPASGIRPPERPRAPAAASATIARIAQPVVKPTARQVALTGPWRVQLGAFSIPANAARLWEGVKHLPELAGREADFVPAGRITKLQVSGFASQQAAQRACRDLARADLACLIVR